MWLEHSIVCIQKQNYFSQVCCALVTASNEKLIYDLWMSSVQVSYLMLLVVDKNLASMQKMQLWFLPLLCIALGHGRKDLCCTKSIY